METGSWLLGGEFEDSVFEEGRERRSGPPASYRAKLCEPQWFYEETESSDDVEALTLKKFRGDLAYRRQDYQKALQEYSSISEKLPPTNFAMKRDVQEGQARCLARLGRLAEALEMAADLETRATNTDHLTTALHLQLAVRAGGPTSAEAILCLQKLISLHPFNPWSWGRLAEAYLNLEPDLSAPFSSSLTRNSCTSNGNTVDSSFPRSGKDCLLCCPKTLPESSVFPVETSSPDKQEEENALTSVPDSVAEEREAVLLETQVKACASLIRTRNTLNYSLVQGTLGAWIVKTFGKSPFPSSMTHGVEEALGCRRVSDERYSTAVEQWGLSSAAGGRKSSRGSGAPAECRLLLQLSQSQQTSFALERNLRTQEEIEDKMKGFRFPEDTLLLMTEVMGKDIVPEKIKDEVHSEVKCVGSAALSALVIASLKEFEDKWFGKIKDHLCSLERPFQAQIQISTS